MEQRTTSSLPFKTVDFNNIYNKINMRANNKKKIIGASTSREEPALNIVDDEEEEEDCWIIGSSRGKDMLCISHKDKTLIESTKERVNHLG